ncbi:MAG: transporter [Firmicutes bacterium]|nr:transporter [Bacillota bacterium]
MFWLESLMSGAALLLELPTGILGDKLGHRRMLRLGQGLMLASYSLFAVARGFWAFALSSVLYGAGLACISGSDSAVLCQSLPGQYRKELTGSAFALLSAAASAGFLVGLITGSWMGATDPAVPVVVNIAPMALAFAATFCLRPAAADGPAEAPPAASDLFSRAAALIRFQPATVVLSLLGTAGFALLNAVYWYNQPLFKRAAIPVAWFGPIMAAAVAIQMVVALSAPRAERSLKLPGALALSLAVPGLAYIAAARSAGPAAVAGLVALVVAGGAWRQPLIQAELNRRITDGARATSLSALSLLGTVAGLCINPVIGRLGDMALATAVLGLGIGLLALSAMALFLPSSQTPGPS